MHGRRCGCTARIGVGNVVEADRTASRRNVAPGHSRLPLGHEFAGAGEDGGFLADMEPRPVKGAWEDALAFWYDLAGEDYRGKW